MKPEEITELFETMATSLRTVQERNAGGGAGRDLTGIPEHARPVEQPKRPAVKVPEKEALKKMFDPQAEEFDPEGAFKILAQANYGDLLGDINSRSVRGMYATFRNEFEDFKDYEADISQALASQDPTTITEKTVLNLFLTAKGLKQTLKERQERGKRSTTTVAPTPTPAAPAAKDTELTDLEVEVANKMFRRIKDPQQRIQEYKKFAKMDEDGGGMSVKVPVGAGKRE